MPTFEPDRGDGYALWTGGALIAEGLLVAISRILTLVYVVALQANQPDSRRMAGHEYVPFVLSGIAIVGIVVWAGAQLRRTPSGAWRAGRLPARAILVLAGILNAALVALAVAGILRKGPHVEGVVAWAVAGIVALSVVIGLIRDAAGLARPTGGR